MAGKIIEQKKQNNSKMLHGNNIRATSREKEIGEENETERGQSA